MTTETLLRDQRHEAIDVATEREIAKPEHRLGLLLDRSIRGADDRVHRRIVCGVARILARTAHQSAGNDAHAAGGLVVMTPQELRDVRHAKLSVPARGAETAE